MSYSDPFGLCPQNLSLMQGYLCNLLEAGMTGLGGAAGFIGGGGAGLLTGPGAVVASPAGAIAGSALGAGAGLLAGRAITNRLFSENAGESGSGTTGDETGTKPQIQPGETANFKYAVKRLGLDKNAASKELHAIKKAEGMGGADNVWINYSNGTVRSQQTGEIIGNLIP